MDQRGFEGWPVGSNRTVLSSEGIEELRMPDLSYAMVTRGPVANRLTAACVAALSRLEAAEAEGIAPDIFNELGETLFWMCALDEVWDRPSAPLLLGLRWARNRVTHGALVAAPAEWQYGTDLGRWVLGKGHLGMQSGYNWLLRVDVAKGPRDHVTPKLESAYDQEVAGRPVVPSLREGLNVSRLG
jgi:hypothetical protein